MIEQKWQDRYYLYGPRISGLIKWKIQKENSFNSSKNNRYHHRHLNNTNSQYLLVWLFYLDTRYSGSSAIIKLRKKSLTSNNFYHFRLSCCAAFLFIFVSTRCQESTTRPTNRLYWLQAAPSTRVWVPLTFAHSINICCCYKSFLEGLEGRIRNSVVCNVRMNWTCLTEKEKHKIHQHPKKKEEKLKPNKTFCCTGIQWTL